MQSQQKIKRQINNIGHISEVIHSTELIAASRLRRSQARLKTIIPYSDLILSLLEDLTSSLNDEEKQSFPLLYSPEGARKNLIIVIGGERGLCGGYLSNILKETQEHIRTFRETEIIVYGTRTGRVLSNRGYNVIEVNSISPVVSFDTIHNISNRIQEKFLSRRYREVSIIYTLFKNAFLYIPVDSILIPIQFRDKSGIGRVESYIFEPSIRDILRELIPLFIGVRLYRIFLETITSEYAARRIAMHQAYENANELLKSLYTTYQRLRQTSITTELIEVSSSRVAIERKK
jgi:F-type H+-transporting ATPase subunit gamma